MSHSDSDFLQPPQQQRSQIRVEQILQAAAEVFWEKGYDVATTHDITKRAQTAVGTLYRFFPNKLAIFHVLEKRHRQYLDRTVPQLMSPEAFQLPLASVIRKIVETYAEYFEDLGPRIVYIQYYLTPNIFLYFDESFDQNMIQGLAKLLQGRNPALTLEKCELLSEVFLRTYQALLLVALRSNDTRRHQLQLEIQNVLINYLEPYVGDQIYADSYDGDLSSSQTAIQAQVEALTQQHALNSRQRAAIAHVLIHGSLTIQMLESICLKPSRRTLQRDLKQLVEKNIFESRGSTNQLVYQMAR
ncbi:TetR/AcrR family transcriptional regulator [Oscillatoria sp. CS-180]|uniref:TetR/AcrR family transcriptional regulator n=1 Tax=Oscillatoria sp. CS-180 TaxID=3021720 RepID=UPI0023300FE5|nr:TetR/AcrR family transcriptional regulator [Oscillatoria sp. CS-180]MDB9527571.1 TetR/AcrR family transcriptional regulator [Oscillatoria sp. CS-180]